MSAVPPLAERGYGTVGLGGLEAHADERHAQAVVARGGRAPGSRTRALPVAGTSGSLSRSSSSRRSAIRLPTPGMPFIAPRSCRAMARDSSGAGSAPSTATAILRTHVRHAQQHPERGALVVVGETVQGERLLAHVRVHPERHAACLVDVRPSESAQRGRHLVADACHVEYEQPVGVLRDDLACEPANHGQKRFTALYLRPLLLASRAIHPQAAVPRVYLHETVTHHVATKAEVALRPCREAP